MSTSLSSTDTTKRNRHKFWDIKRAWFRHVIRFFWVFAFCILIGIPVIIFSVSNNLFGLFGGMPSIEDIENPKNDLSSELISADGVSLGRYFRYNRSKVNFDELSQNLVQTLIISEDRRFYSHCGLDMRGYLRAIIGQVTFRYSGGGSTLTQQLAKNLYTINPDKNIDGPLSKLGSMPRRIIQKIKELIISIDLEKRFTKDQIISLYLNTCTFGSNAFGIKVASETYFNKQPIDLNLQESAVLVGMLQAPTYYNPVTYPERTTSKRNQVLAKVFRAGYKIKNQHSFDSIKSLPIELDFNVQNQNQGLATYFRSVITSYLMSYCKAKDIDLWNSGLRIYTTIDSRIQGYAEEVVKESMKSLQMKFDTRWGGKNPWVDDQNKEIPDFLNSRIKQSDIYKYLVTRFGNNSDSVNIVLKRKKDMKVFSYSGERDTVMNFYDSLAYYKKFLQTGLISMDPITGHIKAWVGGADYKYFKYDHVLQSKRQPGSTFKPFVYGLAIESGYSPCYVLQDISPSFNVSGSVWYPPNSDGSRGTGKKMTIRQAMAQSVNSITAQMMKALGEENVVAFAHRVGIKSKLDAVPSLCLGVSDVSLFEMAGAYSTFVNNGIHTEPFFITKIEDNNGNIIENFIPKTKQSISDQTAYKMIYMLKGGLEESQGTSQGLSYDLRTNNEIGGKTGTTNNASDGWYIGLTHNLVTGIWVGGDEPGIHFNSWADGQGGRTALPIWDKLMTKIYADTTIGIRKGKFPNPPSGIPIGLDCGRYKASDSSRYEKPWDLNN